MPYISPENREFLQSIADATNPGELNYIISRAVNAFMRNHQKRGGKINYELMNSVVGALECAKAEFMRRFLFKYEDKKIVQNGDVYTFHLREDSRNGQ